MNEIKPFEAILRETLNLLKNESVRGSVIIAAAIVEDQLTEILKARLVECEDTKDYLFSGINPPLGSFSSKVDMAFRTGCISLNARLSLHILRKLRNDFVHVSVAINFETQSVIDRVQNLYDLNRDFIHLLWGETRDELYRIAGYYCAPATEDLWADAIRHMSSRTIFEAWASTLIASLNEMPQNIRRITNTVMIPGNAP